MHDYPSHAPPTALPASWLQAPKRGEADIEAGQIVPLEPILDELRASIARMEAKQAGKTKK